MIIDLVKESNVQPTVYWFGQFGVWDSGEQNASFLDNPNIPAWNLSERDYSWDLSKRDYAWNLFKKIF